MASGSERDPERHRIDELIARVREGTISDSELEELALYAEDREEIAEAAARAEEERELGGGWLVRAEADRRIEAAGKSKLVRTERAVGSALLIAGTLGAWISPALGIAAVAGLGILGFSALRVHLKTAIQDPYKDVEK